GALCPEGKVEGMRMLTAALTDRSVRVRRLAASRLDALQGPEALQELRKAYDADEAARPALLRAIAERDRDPAKPLPEKAAADPIDGLRITALDVLGRLDDPSLEETYRRNAESGPDWLRPTALKGYLLLARKKLDGGAKGAALAMFTRS